jgi:hypothetical protein
LERAVAAIGYRTQPIAASLATEVDREEQDRDYEYRALMRKWWFGAAVAGPTMFLSYPQIFPERPDDGDRFPRGATGASPEVWWLISGCSLTSRPFKCWYGPDD